MIAMNRPVKRTAALLLSVIVFTSTSNLHAQDFDIIIRNGRVLDGTRSPEFLADVGIRGYEIIALGHAFDVENYMQQSTPLRQLTLAWHWRAVPVGTPATSAQ